MKNLRHEAEEFLRKQFEIMERYGEAPKLSEEQMNELITETEHTFNRLASLEDSVRKKSFAKASATA
jgi:hypothetical protein